MAIDTRRYAEKRTPVRQSRTGPIPLSSHKTASTPTAGRSTGAPPQSPKRATYVPHATGASPAARNDARHYGPATHPALRTAGTPGAKRFYGQNGHPLPGMGRAGPEKKAPTIHKAVGKPAAHKAATKRAKTVAPKHRKIASPVTRGGSSSSVTGGGAGGVSSGATDPQDQGGGGGLDLGRIIQVGAIAAIAILLVIYLRRNRGKGKRSRK